MATMMEMMESARAKDTAHEPPIWPGLKALEENIRRAQQAVAEGRHATEQLVSSTVSQVQQHPLGAVALATTGGALAGCLMGFALGWRASASRTEYEWIRLF